MAGVITTGNFPKALWPGVNAWFGRQYDEHTVEYTELFMRETSNKAYEEDVLATGFGLAPVKPEGSGISYDTESQGYTKRYVHVAYASGFICTFEEIRDNLYPVVGKRRARALAFSFRQTKENVAAQVYNRAFSASYTGGDAKELCATDHPTKAGDQSNELSTAADLSEASLEDLCIQIGKATNDRGLNISLRPKKLIIPVDLEFEASRIMNSTLQNDTANNAINAMRISGRFPGGIVVNHYLTDTDAWFIMTTSPDGMKYFDRDILPFAQDNDFDTKNAKYAKYERYSFGWTDWRGVYGTPGP